MAVAMAMATGRPEKGVSRMEIKLVIGRDWFSICL